MPLVFNVDILPDHAAEGRALMGEEGRAEQIRPGISCLAAVERTDRDNHLAIVEAWSSDADFDRHVSTEHAKSTRRKLQPLLASPFDERMFRPRGCGSGLPPQPEPARLGQEQVKPTLPGRELPTRLERYSRDSLVDTLASRASRPYKVPMSLTRYFVSVFCAASRSRPADAPKISGFGSTRSGVSSGARPMQGDRCRYGGGAAMHACQGLDLPATLAVSRQGRACRPAPSPAWSFRPERPEAVGVHPVFPSKLQFEPAVGTR